MTADEDRVVSEPTAPTPWSFWGWIVALIAFAVLSAGGVALEMAGNRQESARAHRDRMDATVLESGLRAGELGNATDGSTTLVRAGIYVDRIPELNIKDAVWTVDFYVWFAWEGDDWRLGESFTVVDGVVQQREKVDELHEGTRHYVRYRAVASVSKFFDVRRFPLDDHLLTLNIECPSFRRTVLQFVPDTTSSVSSRVQVAAYHIGRTAIIEKPHRYASAMGDPRLAQARPAVYSQLRLGIPLERNGWAFFVKLFQGTLAAIAVAGIVFFLRPTNLDPRFGLGVGAFFAAIANSYVSSSLIPDTGVMTLADALNGIAMALIFMSLVQSTISLYFFETLGRPLLSRRFDRVSGLAYAGGALLLYVLIPWAAVG